MATVTWSKTVSLATAAGIAAVKEEDLVAKATPYGVDEEALRLLKEAVETSKTGSYVLSVWNPPNEGSVSVTPRQGAEPVSRLAHIDSRVAAGTTPPCLWQFDDLTRVSWWDGVYLQYEAEFRLVLDPEEREWTFSLSIREEALPVEGKDYPQVVGEWELALKWWREVEEV